MKIKIGKIDMPNVEFTKIAIIESLTESFKSGVQLKGYIEGLKEEYLEYVPPVCLYSVENIDEFKSVICSLIAESKQQDEQFILHLEVHGLNDQSGICFKNGSKLSWEDLGIILVPLNCVMGFNLLVCMASCFGINLLKVVKPSKPAPCLAVIGPTDITNGPELLQHFRNFYRELLNELDLVQAFKHLTQKSLDQGGFICKTADIWFFEVMMDSINGYYFDNELLDIRVDEIIQALPSCYKEIERGLVKEIIKATTINYIKKSFNNFFMIQDVPKNYDRFSQVIEIIKNKIKLD